MEGFLSGVVYTVYGPLNDVRGTATASDASFDLETPWGRFKAVTGKRTRRVGYHQVVFCVNALSMRIFSDRTSDYVDIAGDTRRTSITLLFQERMRAMVAYAPL